MTKTELNNINKLIDQEIEILDMVPFTNSYEDLTRLRAAFKIFLVSDNLELKKQWFEIKYEIVKAEESYAKWTDMSEASEYRRWNYDKYGHEDDRRHREELAPLKEKIKEIEQIIMTEFI